MSTGSSPEELYQREMSRRPDEGPGIDRAVLDGRTHVVAEIARRQLAALLRVEDVFTDIRDTLREIRDEGRAARAAVKLELLEAVPLVQQPAAKPPKQQARKQDASSAGSESSPPTAEQ